MPRIVLNRRALSLCLARRRIPDLHVARPERRDRHIACDDAIRGSAAARAFEDRNPPRRMASPLQSERAKMSTQGLERLCALPDQTLPERSPRVSSPFTGPKRIVGRVAAAVCWRVTQGFPQAGGIRRPSRAGLAAPEMRAAAGVHGDTAARPPAEEAPHLARLGVLRKAPWPEAEAPWARIAAGDRHSLRQTEPDSGDLRQDRSPKRIRAHQPSYTEPVGGGHSRETQGC